MPLYGGCTTAAKWQISSCLEPGQEYRKTSLLVNNVNQQPGQQADGDLFDCIINAAKWLVPYCILFVNKPRNFVI